ncbi:response regulator [Bifidobacterium sp.]|jgi:DNA-binding NarL/FixJ family response regulator|uniref:response regulator n=1 Tax=Bifidobacterium sp. TaxID=41200 RepID=UPI0025C66274|nr:response regulator transcription factor [Bifidobacterium sp.]MCI1635679.1 response regulator transcription factor [Bifidobacterium sp.]
MIRTMVIDDQEMIRVGLSTIIGAAEGVTMVATACDGLSALKMLETTQVDVILMDLRMPGIDGVETTRRIRQRLTSQMTRIIVLTTFDQDENVILALRAGANGFLSKGVGPQDLTDSIREVMQGGGALSPKAAAALITHVIHSQDAPSDPEAVKIFSSLTEREYEIVQAAVSGLDNAAISEQLFISQYTVKTHLNRAMAKVNAHDRAGLITLAYKAGIRPA